MKCSHRHFAIVAIAALFVMPASAEAVLIDDFSGLSTGNLHNQNLWATIAGTNTTSTGNVQVDYRDGNLAARYSGCCSTSAQNRGLRKNIRNAGIDEGATGTMYLEFFVAGENPAAHFGLSPHSGPNTWNHFASQMGLIGDGSGGIDLNGGATKLASLAPHTRYQLWAVNDNLNDTYDVYLRGGTYTEQTQLGSGISFRSGTTNRLQSFFGYTAAVTGGTSPVELDNIHVRPGVDLSDPTVIADGALAQYALVSGTDYSSPATLVADGFNATPMTTVSGNWSNSSVGFHSIHGINSVAPEGAGGNTNGLPDSFSEDAYFSLTLTPEESSMRVTGLELTHVAGKTGSTGGLTSNIVVRSSLDGFAADLEHFELEFDGNNGEFVSEVQSLDLSNHPAFSSITEPLELRFYLFNGSGVDNKYSGFTDLTIYGLAVPEPSTYAMGLLAAAGIGLVLHRRKGRTGTEHRRGRRS